VIYLLEINQFILKQGMTKVCENELCAVYEMQENKGDGIIICYQIFPGISVMYNNFHTIENSKRIESENNCLSIHHCREGRIEAETINGEYLYLEPGDVLIEKLDSKYTICSFPLSHFHGITMNISLSESVEGRLNELLDYFNINVMEIKKLFSSESIPIVLHKEEIINHIFNELYILPNKMKKEYLQIKVIELFILLKSIDLSQVNKTQQYFYKSQVEKIKEIKKLITSNLDRHYTMTELAKIYDLSLSALKKCFKGVYGEAIYSYVSNYKMNVAAHLLLKTDESVTTIAGKLGYTNVSKFSEVFKKNYGESPKEYRKINTLF